MARIIGVEIPDKKRIDIALRYIYGIGAKNSVAILDRAKVDHATRAKDLSEQCMFYGNVKVSHAQEDGKSILKLEYGKGDGVFG